MKKLVKWICGILSIVLVFEVSAIGVSAKTVYLSDNTFHEEGYIFVGESHAILASAEVNRVINEEKIKLVDDLNFHLLLDESLEVNEMKEPNTFTMQGNLFFVFEGNSDMDFQKQIKREYIYSDGKGNCGDAVKKIHEIIELNTNIEHWNIITWHGANACRGGKVNADYYVASYRNWMDYEFPEADIYILSQSTMTKAYRGCRKQADIFNATLKKAFPNNYLDYTDYFNEKYPHEMYDPKLRSDLIHWNLKTYVELFQDVMLVALERRSEESERSTLAEK